MVFAVLQLMWPKGMSGVKTVDILTDVCLFGAVPLIVAAVRNYNSLDKFFFVRILYSLMYICSSICNLADVIS